MTTAAKRFVFLCAIVLTACAGEEGGAPARKVVAPTESPLVRGDALLAAGKPHEAIAAYGAAAAPDPQVTRGLGLAYAALERWDEAHATLAPYVKAHARDARAQQAFIAALLGRGSLEEAQLAATSAAQLATDDLGVQLLTACLAQTEAERRAALARLLAFESTRPALPGQAALSYELLAVRAELRRALLDAAGAAADEAAAHKASALDAARVIELAAIYRRTHQTAAAGRLLARVAALEPPLPVALRALAEVSLELDEPERALDALGRMPPSGALPPVDSVLEARAQLALGQPQVAVERLRALIAALESEQRVALAARSRLWLSRALLAQGELALAREALGAIGDPSVQLDRDLALAEIELAYNDVDKARALLAGVLARQPGLVAAQLLLASTEVKAGAPAEAEKQLRALAAAHPQDARIAQALAGVLDGLGDLEGARAEHLRALMLAPGSLAPLRALLAIYDARGEPQSGDELIREQCALAPRNGALQRVLGERLERRGDAAGAEAAFRAGLEADERGDAAWIAFADFYARNRKPVRALELLEHVLRGSPDDADALVRAGAALRRLDQPADAAARYERALRLRPRDVAIQNTLAVLLSEDPAQRGRALALAEAARQTAPSSPHVQATLGYVRMRRGELQLALPLLRDSAKALPEDAAVQHHFAVAQLLSGDAEAGRKTLALARKLDPSLPSEDAALRALKPR